MKLTTIGLQLDDIVNVSIADLWTTGINAIIHSVELTYNDFIQKRQVNVNLQDYNYEHFIPYKNDKQKQFLSNKFAKYKLRAKVICQNNNLELEIIDLQGYMEK